MIESVLFTNKYGESVEIILREPEKSGYAITGITGIEPTNVDLKMTQISTGTKFIFNKGFHQNRTISFAILYYPSNDLLMGVDELRSYLYDRIKPNTEIKMHFRKNNVSYCIVGYVSKHQGETFSNACGAQIEIQCPDIWFIENDIDFYKTKTVIYSDGQYNTQILYGGTFRSGFIFDISANTAVYGDFELNINSVKSYSIYLNIPYNVFKSGDILRINTENDSINMLIYDSINDRWSDATKYIDIRSLIQRKDLPVLENGLNTVSLRKTNDTIASNSLNCSIKYKTLYMGV